MVIKIFAITVSFIILLVVIDLIRRERLTFKYAIGWILLALTAIFFEVFDSLLVHIARWFGFALPSNFIFFMLLVFFVFWSLFLTMFLCQQNSRNDTMAQKLGILDLELRQLKSEMEEKERVEEG